MKILFLDDDRQRHLLFQRGHRGRADVTIAAAWSYSEAVTELLVNDAFDIAYLDHDLELTHSSAQLCKNGFDVAQFIVSLPEDRRPRSIVIHSWNDLGRIRMRDLLVGAGIPTIIEPFGGIS